LEKGITIKYSANYYPQGNGLAESTNKNLIQILKKIVHEHQINWHKQLYNALWEDRVTPKKSIGNSPYFLVYGKEAILPPNIFLPSLQLAQSVQEEPCSKMKMRIDALINLEEERDKTKEKFHEHQAIIKIWFDKHSTNDKEFQVGDLVLKWDKAHEEKGKHTKFQHLWLGPFIISKKLGPSTFILQTLNGEIENLPINGQILKKYFA
jgi:hypothetical protein